MNPAVPSPLLASLFPAGVYTAELRGPGDPALLYPEEAAHLGQSVAKRAAEFAAGRLCARAVMAELGIADFPLRVGGDRRPLWPAGVVGSITHTHGFGAAVAAPDTHFRAIGVDAEVVGRVREALWPKICAPQELTWLAAQRGGAAERLAALVFSAKEAFYKCQYGLTQGWVGFHDVMLDLALDPDGGRFSVLPLKPLQLQQELQPPWEGRFHFEQGLVVSGMAFAAQ